MAVERVLFLLVVIFHSMNNYAAAGKDKDGKEIVGDGNCFYRCLSLYLYDDQDEHSVIRQRIIRHMSGGDGERSRRYGRLMHNTSQSYGDYLRLHSNNGQWADEPIIQAAADLYGFNIYVSSYGNSGVSQLVRATSEQLRNDSSRLLHLRLENYHYTCIEHDCETDSVPSGDFQEILKVIKLGKQNGAEPYEDSRNVLDYSKTVDHPKTVGDDESSNAGIDTFNNEDLENQFCWIDTEEEESVDCINEICEDIRNISIAEEKTPEQKFTICRDMEHLKELCKTGQVKCGTVCRVRRLRLGHEYHHYFMIWEVLQEGLDIIELTLTWPLRICCKIHRVSFDTGNNSLLDFQQGVFIACSDIPVNESQIEAMRCRLEEVLSWTHINYSLISKEKFHCQSLIAYIKTGKKHFSEVDNFVERYPIQGPFIIVFVSFVTFLISILTHCIYFGNKDKSLFQKTDITWILVLLYLYCILYFILKF